MKAAQSVPRALCEQTAMPETSPTAPYNPAAIHKLCTAAFLCSSSGGGGYPGSPFESNHSPTYLFALLNKIITQLGKGTLVQRFF